MPETPMTPDSAPRGPLRSRAQAPSELPLPDAAEVSWRELTRADIPALVEVIGRIEEADHPPYRTTVEEVEDYFAPGYDTAGIGGFADDDQGELMQAYGFVRLSQADRQVKRVFVSGGVAPTFRDRGMGSPLMDWQLGRARQLLAECAEAEEDVAARIVAHVDDDREDFTQLLTSRGFTPRRTYSQLRRDLSQPLPTISLERSVTVEPWTEALDDAVRRAHNTAFRDLWGSQPLTPQAWQQERTHHAPEWSFVALDRSSDRAQVAGYLISGRYEQDWPALGWTEGYIENLGVLPAWRGRHVATALLTRAMEAYRHDGMQYAGMDVDSDNPTGAIGLFERLGFERVRGSAVYTVEV
ncbi:GNAT family N-acetyltransferase [Bogoriella caseilytica]|nr:GNAT family N-acetyltransferase [Bogoriella caseilytica]